MQLTSIKTLMFHKDPQQTSGSPTFVAKPTGRGEYTTAPDWLNDNDYFKTCVACGWVTVVEVKSEPTMAAPSPEPAGIANFLKPEGGAEVLIGPGEKKNDAKKSPPGK